jgi:hypothetical protein
MPDFRNAVNMVFAILNRIYTTSISHKPFLYFATGKNCLDECDEHRHYGTDGEENPSWLLVLLALRILMVAEVAQIAARLPALQRAKLE